MAACLTSFHLPGAQLQVCALFRATFKPLCHKESHTIVNIGMLGLQSESIMSETLLLQSGRFVLQSIGSDLYLQPRSLPNRNNLVLKKKAISTCNPLPKKQALLVCGSIDDEFRSSRNIAISLHRRYKNVVERGFSNNIKEFITAGVTAYAVGCTDEGLRSELLSLKDADDDSFGKSSMGATTSVKLKLTTENIDECILWSTIVFITILCTPQPTVVRWSSASPVSEEAQSKWQGFCALIANAYYVRGMAWLPVKTLQLEQMAVMGHAEEPSIVADRMRIVFATLESVSPQWPKG